MSNTTIITITIITVFLVVGVMLPYVESAFNSTSHTAGADDLESTLLGSSQDEAKVNAFDILAGIGKVAFWSFGSFPIWLELIFTLLRVTLIICIVFLVRGV